MDIVINVTDRPWGYYIKFLQEEGVWVKRVEVNPSGRLSLQKHLHRSEKWNIVTGKGFIELNGEEKEVGPGDVVDIPVGVEHRIANVGNERLVFIEVACGDDLSEEDIVRIEDDYYRKGE
ncbi:MAG: phosphomannose isomerase type II C-terminal cupin domain [Candidatus Omnitrophica bacterium]|nr:phosphomannose isomerase type II C-terminal cupin domain [Candidatus Omnitrophota bacterium]MBU1997216.1 phosphomannose isomerase type II C-terminal cupin domain [Candidatus Omnitrophota bacterium]MBU4333140.1 phosphomannose isomerase type II C-terminal cupin domain [Candidatus Omnitrophota bacterium]